MELTNDLKQILGVMLMTAILLIISVNLHYYHK